MARYQLLFACLLAAMPVVAQAAEAAFEPEIVTVKPAIDPGPNVFVNQQAWGGAGSIHVYSADDLTYKGNMSLGAMGQMLISPDGKTAYSQSSYMKRYMYGDNEQVLQVFDVATLTPIKEVILPPKAAMLAAYQPMLEQSADGRLIYVQNATPASSVTVVDIAAGSVVQELPTPGCWGIYPASSGHGFSSICGDGTFASFALGEDGKGSARRNSEKIFDVDYDALFTSAERIDGRLGFMSFTGNLYLLDDAGGAVVLDETLPIAADVDGYWAPGGYKVFGYNAPSGVLFVTMHAGAEEGSHKDASDEIWAYDVRQRQLLYRSPIGNVNSLVVTDDAVPVVYGLDENPRRVERFDADPDAKFVLKRTAAQDRRGASTLLAVRN